MTVAIPLLRDVFYHDGRGPELHRAHFARNGLHLVAIDYWLPDASREAKSLRHLEFIGAQAFMVTPEEVENYANSQPWNDDGAAIYSLGRSEWLRSFAQQHLTRCEHFRIMFYDEYLDAICESVRSHSGGYVSGNQP